MDTKTAMQLKTIANRLYGIRLPAVEVDAINNILASAHDLVVLADAAGQNAEKETE